MKGIFVLFCLSILYSTKVNSRETLLRGFEQCWKFWIKNFPENIFRFIFHASNFRAHKYSFFHEIKTVLTMQMKRKLFKTAIEFRKKTYFKFTSKHKG